MEVGCKVDLG